MSDEIEPWHDTEIHNGDCGPIAPLSDRFPVDTADPSLVRCATCGAYWQETDLIKLARIWFSTGAYEGKLRAEEIAREKSLVVAAETLLEEFGK